MRRCYRVKNGKRHAYWALVESVRTGRGPRQQVVAYLGQIDVKDAWLSSMWPTARRRSSDGWTSRGFPRNGSWWTPGECVWSGAWSSAGPGWAGSFCDSRG